MGVCSSQKRSNEFKISKKRAKSSQSLQISKDDDNDAEHRKRSSRLSNTRNSLIIAHKNANSGPDIQGIPQSQSFFVFSSIFRSGRLQQFPVVLINQEISLSSRDSFEVKDESIEIQEVNCIAKHDNYLKSISQNYVLFNLVDQEVQEIVQTDLIRQPVYQESVHSNQSGIKPPLRRNNFPFQIHKSNTQRELETIYTKQQILKYQSEIIFALSSQLEKRLNLQEIQKQVIVTINYLMESLQLYQLNTASVLWIIKKYLKDEQIELIIDEQIQTKSTKNVITAIDFQDIALMNCNISKFFFEIAFKDSQNFNFRIISGNPHQRKTFLKEVEKFVRDCMDAKGKQQQFFWLKAALIKQSDHYQFSLYFYLAKFPMDSCARFERNLSDILLKHYKSSYLGIKTNNLVSCIKFSMGTFDAWGNREFKTAVSELDEQNGNLEIFQYMRPVGWNIIRRFGLQSKHYLSPEKFQSEYVNGYMKVISTESGPNDFFDKLFESEDIGPNRDSFQLHKCGAGIIICQNIQNLLPISTQSKIPMKMRLKPLQIKIQNEIRYYYIVIQVTVEKAKIRIPSEFGIQLYIVNHVQGVKNKGILIKEINETEFLEATKLIGNQ